jgi:hypothetical protein
MTKNGDGASTTVRKGAEFAQVRTGSGSRRRQDAEQARAMGAVRG